MLVFPQWRPEFPASGCSVPRWMPAKHFAPYLARPVALPPNLGYQIEDEESSGSSSPERERTDEDAFCGWRGCGLRFVNVARLSTHVARCHAAHAHRDGLFYCGWQGCTRPQRGFNARYKMLVHIRTHTNERPHTCSQCNKSFSRAENLKIHLRSHSGEKPYVCPYEGCGKAYSNSSDRFKHTRTHTVDKPYCCKVPGCNKRYTDPSSLRKHVKTYKHFAIEDQKKDLSDEVREFSPLRENSNTFSTIESTSPHHVIYSPKANVSPIPPYNPILPEVPPLTYGHVYMRPIDPVYSIRVPSHEMSHLEYTQMYEHAYKNYYSNYPVLRTSVSEKVFTYDEPMIQDVVMKPIERSRSPIYKLVEEEMPLNLICAKRPIEELVRRTDLPLDLSTKS